MSTVKEVKFIYGVFVEKATLKKKGNNKKTHLKKKYFFTLFFLSYIQH